MPTSCRNGRFCARARERERFTVSLGPRCPGERRETTVPRSTSWAVTWRRSDRISAAARLRLVERFLYPVLDAFQNAADQVCGAGCAPVTC